jgi:hypothetical protein
LLYKACLIPAGFVAFEPRFLNLSFFSGFHLVQIRRDSWC